MKLRNYQADAIKAIVKGFNCGNKQYIVMPTGSGKTITFLSYASKNHSKILIIVPSKELMRQVYETSLNFYHKSEISRKGDKFDEKISKLHICIINSIQGKHLTDLLRAGFDLIIIDECHHSQSKSYKKLLKGLSDLYEYSDYKVLGVTATPNRRDGKLLEEILHTCTFKLSIESMIESGNLSDIEGFNVKTKIDLKDIDDHNGDFSLLQLYNKLCTESRNNLIIDIYKKEMIERKTIIFCINIKHSKIITQLLKSCGISAAHIDGTMNAIERNAILTSFRNGEISVICNCQLLTEGFDEPSIDGIILARPTKSSSLFIQMIGRGLRLFPGKKNCKIIDIVDNHKKLAGFNSLLSELNSHESGISEIEKFGSFKEVKEHFLQERLKVIEFSIEKIKIFERSGIYEFNATESMIDYLQNNNITYFEPLSFDEASFLIWFDKLKKEIYGLN